MSALNTASFNDFVALANVLWHKSADSIPQMVRSSGLFKVGVFPPNSGESKVYSEIDMEEYAHKKSESAAATVITPQQGYTKTSNLIRLGDNVSISYEMRKRNKAPQVISGLTSLGRLVPNRLDLDLSHRIGFGTETDYTDMDGESVDISTGETTSTSLFDTTHDLKGSTKTFRNRLANNPQISKGGLEGMENLINTDTYNQFGQSMVNTFDILWCANNANTVNTARELLRSTADLGAPNAGVVNVYQGKYRLVVLPRVATTATGAFDSDKDRYWGIASSMDSSAFLDIEEEATMLAPTVGDGINISTDDWTFGTRGSYAICIVGSRWIKMSDGLGTA